MKFFCRSQYIFLFLVLFTIYSCNQESKQVQKLSPIDSSASSQHTFVDSSINEVDPDLDGICSVISGLEVPENPKFNKITDNPHWKNFSSNLVSRFNKLDSSRLSKMRNWRDKEIAKVSDESQILFYPFSGPDFLNAFTFFPQQKNLYMFALEAPGTLPKLEELEADTSYFASIDKSLWSILNFSFFRTNSMKVDLKAKDLNGAVHLIALFLKKTGNKIIQINPVFVDAKGEINEKKDSSKCFVNAIQILYLNCKTNSKSSICYFSCDLSDSAILKNDCLRNMIINMDNGFTTYLKSASYLMHQGNFSWIRKIILSKSNHLLQDDSGIPLKYIDSTWNKTFFGTYDKPISLFKNKYQENLKQAFNPENQNVKPLPFGIGYDYKLNESNLMLFSKKSKL